MSDSSKEKIRLSLIGKKESEARNWQGGISPQHKIRTAPRIMPDKCEVCGLMGKSFKKGLHYDHNHRTGKFRGWLCIKCNMALGMVGDNINILEKLIVYLKKIMNKMNNRVIKFRAWDEQEKQWFRFPFVVDSQGRVFREYIGGGKVEKNVAITQFTGLKDSKGVEIYEGDIIIAENGIKRIVEFKEGCFCEANSFPATRLPAYCEVIGNVFENPNLIK